MIHSKINIYILEKYKTLKNNNILLFNYFRQLYTY